MSIRIVDKKKDWPLSPAMGLRRHGALQKVSRDVLWLLCHMMRAIRMKRRVSCMKLQYLSQVFSTDIF